MYLKQMEVESRVEYFKGDIQEIIKAHKTVKKWAYILHDKDDTAPHYHIYLNFGSSGVDTKQVAEWFGLQESQISKIKGRATDMLLYLTHGNESQKNKYQYDPTEVVANFDFETEIKKAKILGDWENFSYAQQLEYVHTLSPSERASAFRQLRLLWQEYCQWLSLQTDREIEVYFICGKGGTGKTYYAKKLLKKMNLWAYNFNVIAIVLEFFAFYFYFIVSYDFAGIYTQLYKLLIDLSPAIVFIPVWVWCIVGALVFDRVRKNIGYKLLNYNEDKNREFIDDRPIIFMVNGTMGKKKTTAITDMALSQEVMFRDKAHEKMFENDMKFPNFPWLTLINDLKRGMEYHHIYNLATTSEFIKKKQARWKKCPCREKIFGYDYERYGLTYDDKLKITDIWETIENYARLFFVYFVKSSLIISNYAIRTDNELIDLGNFPLWDTDFFQRDSHAVKDSGHSHIMDFDMFRLGKKMVNDNPYLNSFEFGIEVITELGKERGNMVELVDKKKKDETTNQKNDGYNNDKKMKRHSGTVDNFPFVRAIGDEQRPESLGADLRQLCDLVHIKDSGKPKLTMPFFTLGEILYDWIIGKFCDLYYQYSHVRGDNTLIMYLLKNFSAVVEHYYKRIYNRFGYCVLTVAVENGNQDGNLKECKYYLMNKKIYSDRFSTDCYSDFFHERALRSDIGLNDLPEYEKTRASLDELKQQNSYFVNDLVEGFNKINGK